MIEIPLGGFWPSALPEASARPIADAAAPTLEGQEPQELTAEDAGLSLFATMLQSLTDPRPRLPEAPQGGAHDGPMTDTPQVPASGVTEAEIAAVPGLSSGQAAAVDAALSTASLSVPAVPAGSGDATPAPVLLSSALLAGVEQHTVLQPQTGAASAVAPSAMPAPGSSPTQLPASAPPSTDGMRRGESAEVDAGSPLFGAPAQGPGPRRSFEGRRVTAGESDAAAVARGASAAVSRHRVDLEPGTAREFRRDRAEAAQESPTPTSPVARSTSSEVRTSSPPGEEALALASPVVGSDRSRGFTPTDASGPAVATPPGGRFDAATIVASSHSERRIADGDGPAGSAPGRESAVMRSELHPFAPTGPMITVSPEWVLESVEPVAAAPVGIDLIDDPVASAAAASAEAATVASEVDGEPKLALTEAASPRINLAALVRGRQDGLMLAAEAEARGLTLRLTDFLESGAPIPRAPETVAVIRVPNLPIAVPPLGPGADASSDTGSAELLPLTEPAAPQPEAEPNTDPAIVPARNGGSGPAVLAPSSTSEAVASTQFADSEAPHQVLPGATSPAKPRLASDGGSRTNLPVETATELPAGTVTVPQAATPERAGESRPRPSSPPATEKVTGAAVLAESGAPQAGSTSRASDEPNPSPERISSPDQPAPAPSSGRADRTDRREPSTPADERRSAGAARFGAAAPSEPTSPRSESESGPVAPSVGVNTGRSERARSVPTVRSHSEAGEPAVSPQTARPVGPEPQRASSAPTAGPTPSQSNPVRRDPSTVSNRGGLSESTVADTGPNLRAPGSETKSTSPAPTQAPTAATRSDASEASLPLQRSASSTPREKSDPAAASDVKAVIGQSSAEGRVRPAVASDAAATSPGGTVRPQAIPWPEESGIRTVPSGTGAPRATTVAGEGAQPTSAAGTTVTNRAARHPNRGEGAVVRPSDPAVAEAAPTAATVPVSGAPAKRSPTAATPATPVDRDQSTAGMAPHVESPSVASSKGRAATNVREDVNAQGAEPTAGAAPKEELSSPLPTSAPAIARSSESGSAPHQGGVQSAAPSLGTPAPTPVSSPATGDARVTLPELGARLPERVQVALSEGRREARIHLHPPELGSIDVRLQLEGDRVTAALSAEREEVRTLLIGLESELRDGMEKAGLKLERLDVAAAASRPQTTFDPAVVSAPNAPQSTTTSTAGDARGQGFEGRGGQPGGERAGRDAHAEPRQPRPEPLRRSATGVDIRV